MTLSSIPLLGYWGDLEEELECENLKDLEQEVEPVEPDLDFVYMCELLKYDDPL